MLFCKSSTVKVGTIALICTISCVVATIASVCFVVFVHPHASGPRPDLQARPCGKNFAGTDAAGGPSDVALRTAASLERVSGIRRRLPLRAHVEEIDQEVVGQRL